MTDETKWRGQDISGEPDSMIAKIRAAGIAEQFDETSQTPTKLISGDTKVVLSQLLKEWPKELVTTFHQN
jgi:hypothetical protein